MNNAIDKQTISVVIPLYNKEQYVARAILSVLSQIYPVHEIIIVDDGSQDSSVAQVNSLLTDHNNITLLTQANSGPSAARNKGMERASGEWIALLDADDWWEPNHLSSLIEGVENFPECLVSVSHYQFEYVNHSQLAHCQTQDEGIIDDYFAACCHYDLPITSSSIIMHRQVFEFTKGFDEAIQKGEDQILWSNIAILYPIYFSAQCTMHYWIGERAYQVHHMVLTPAPQLEYYKALLTSECLSQQHRSSLGYLAHLTILHCIKHNLMTGDKDTARTLLNTHWAVQSDRFSMVARVLLWLPTLLTKWILRFA